MLPFIVIVMSAWIPIAYGQSTSISISRAATTLRPLNSVVSSVIASRSSTAVVAASSSAAATTSAAAARPTLQFATIDELTACETTDVTWAISGLRSDLYEISLFVIDAGAVASSSASSSPSSSTSRAAVASTVSSAAPTSIVRTSTAVAASSTATAARSTILVGRHMIARQSQRQTNTTLVTGQIASQPYTFDVALPAGRYYISGTLNDPFRTTARSNVFVVEEGNDVSCLASGVSSSSSASRSSITAGVMQTTGAGAAANQATTTSSISGGAIAGIVIGVIGGLGLLAFLALFCVRRRRRQARASMANGGGGGDKSERFATLPSASSQDGENGSGAGGYPIAAAWRRNSDSDEKTIEGADDPYSNTSILNRQNPAPFPSSGMGHQEILTAADMPPSLGETRRQSGPPLTHTLVQKTSMQGIIGKDPSSNESSAEHSRSNSNGGTSRPPVTQNGSGQKDSNGAGVGRSTSTKRKPVPSLGPELRGQLERERKMSEGAIGSRKASIPDVKRYSLVPDRPLPQA